MKEILKLQQKIVPELIEVLEKRYNILRTIFYNGPIGRRVLATELDIGERTVRTEINFLKSQNLINISTPGMTVTDEGEEVLEKLKTFIYELRGLSDLEESLRRVLKSNKVIIVPGDVDEDESVMKDLGKAAATYVKSIITNDSIITLTGGTTIKEVVDNFPMTTGYDDILILPARGGMGRNVETQANTLAANLSKRLNGNYKMLHIPDSLSDQAISAMMNEEYISEIVGSIKNADIFLYGIGNAESMCRKRNMSEERTQEIMSKGAEGEAFGCYFSAQGEVVYSISSVGITGEDTENIERLVAVAGGKFKAKAIIATQLKNSRSVLVTDEGAAREILQILSKDIKNN